MSRYTGNRLRLGAARYTGNWLRLGAVGIVVALVASLASATPATASDHGDGWRQIARQLVSAYVGTARYHHLPFATRDGYAAFPAGVPLHECIDEDVDLDDTDGKPAMGVHWVKPALLDDRLDAAHPEVLVFEPRRNGRLRLVALEYVVFESTWGSPETTEPPRLFGRELQYVPAPNRFGLPAFYQVHAWTWKRNPGGLFANMSPRVSCAYG